MSISLDISQDGGITWTSLGGSGLDLPNSGFTFDGLGNLINSQGQPALISGVIVSLPQPANPLRMIRGSVDLSEDFLTVVTVELA